MPAMSATLVRGELLRDSSTPRPGNPSTASIVMRCPACGRNGTGPSDELLAAESKPFACRACAFKIVQDGGIWRALPPERQDYFSQFIRNYEYVRQAEGRGSSSADFYLGLPFHDVTGQHSWQWSIRARTHGYVVRNILPTLSSRKNANLKVMDLGAGNGWLSYRLASLGHLPVAVDLLTNEFDGLGAAVHFESKLPKLFPRFQAELDHLPFADGQFDCTIFNASFHYSENYARTMAEAIRCTRSGGMVVIADSPTYSREEYGQQMVEERKKTFEKKFGFRSDILGSSEFLTPKRLLDLGAEFQIRWKSHRVWYGFQWAFRPLISRLKRRRDPSQFVLYTAQVKTQ